MTSSRQHGYARYRLDGCRCYVCGWARSKYEENRQKRIAAGTWQPWKDAGPVRAHLVKLKSAGVGERRIHELTGVSRTAITGLLRGRRGNPPTDRLRPATAAAILALEPDMTAMAEGAVVDGTGTARRIQALCCLGWTLTAHAARVGWTVQNYSPLKAGHPVTASTARLVARLYEQLSMIPAPETPGAARARRMARSAGWLPPLAWDDDELDAPACDGADGLEGREAWAARFLDLQRHGLPHREIAARLGHTEGGLYAKVSVLRRGGLLPEPTRVGDAA
ncbi:hypothetical protein ACIA5D_17855 [Actinoplanes sp. NPDC051513]|uniref:hypothetical protein n=1 Tax=Actinoplanes sp. NPDC051513 TaxID=3363908 RepID=UPI0037894037